jgi:hypothetical protein
MVHRNPHPFGRSLAAALSYLSVNLAAPPVVTERPAAPSEPPPIVSAGRAARRVMIEMTPPMAPLP